jgi:hypothetical protein
MRDLRFCPIRVSTKKLDLGEIARIVLPTDRAMCEVLWYAMVLVLIHMVIHMPCTSFVDTESGGANVLTPCRLFLRGDLCG